VSLNNQMQVAMHIDSLWTPKQPLVSTMVKQPTFLTRGPIQIQPMKPRIWDLIGFIRTHVLSKAGLTRLYNVTQEGYNNGIIKKWLHQELQFFTLTRLETLFDTSVKPEIQHGTPKMGKALDYRTIDPPHLEKRWGKTADVRFVGPKKRSSPVILLFFTGQFDSLRHLETLDQQ